MNTKQNNNKIYYELKSLNVVMINSIFCLKITRILYQTKKNKIINVKYKLQFSNFYIEVLYKFYVYHNMKVY